LKNFKITYFKSDRPLNFPNNSIVDIFKKMTIK